MSTGSIKQIKMAVTQVETSVLFCHSYKFVTEFGNRTGKLLPKSFNYLNLDSILLQVIIFMWNSYLMVICHSGGRHTPVISLHFENQHIQHNRKFVLVLATLLNQCSLQSHLLASFRVKNVNGI
jgi:hypothetical protein